MESTNKINSNSNEEKTKKSKKNKLLAFLNKSPDKNKKKSGIKNQVTKVRSRTLDDLVSILNTPEEDEVKQPEGDGTLKKGKTTEDIDKKKSKKFSLSFRFSSREQPAAPSESKGFIITTSLGLYTVTSIEADCISCITSLDSNPNFATIQTILKNPVTKKAFKDVAAIADQEEYTNYFESLDDFLNTTFATDKDFFIAFDTIFNKHLKPQASQELNIEATTSGQPAEEFAKLNKERTRDNAKAFLKAAAEESLCLLNKNSPTMVNKVKFCFTEQLEKEKKFTIKNNK